MKIGSIAAVIALIAGGISVAHATRLDREVREGNEEFRKRLEREREHIRAMDVSHDVKVINKQTGEVIDFEEYLNQLQERFGS